MTLSLQLSTRTEALANSGGRTLALLIAPPPGDGLGPLATSGTSAALPFALGLRVVDFQLATLLRAGVSDVIVVQPEAADRSLQDHLREVWQPSFSRLACLAGQMNAKRGGFGLPVLRRCLALIKAIEPAEVLVLSADRICDPDLGAMIAFHREQGAVATLEALPGEDPTSRLQAWLPALSLGDIAETGMMIFNWAWLRDGLEAERITGANLPEQVISRVMVGGNVQVWSGAQPRAYWRSLDSLDTFRVTWLDFEAGSMLPCRLPTPEAEPAVMGRSPLLPNVRDSVIMPGASVAPGAFVSRAIIAPGAHVPDGVVIGQDPELDARCYHLTLGGTTLVTAEMLAALR